MGKLRAKVIEASGQGRVVGIFDPCRDATKPYKWYASDREAIVDNEVDAVFICTPNHRIAPLCKAALENGKHVFAEKPPAHTAACLKEVRFCERTSGKVLMYGFNHRHHSSIIKMKEMVDSRSMGKVLWMRGRYGKEVDESFFRGWRANKDLAGGGIMLDQGIHMLDLFLHIGGKFDEVHAIVSNLFWKIDGIEDNVFAIFRNTRTGVCASLHSTMTQWRYLFSLEVFLEGGALILNGLKTSSNAYGDEKLAIKRNSTNHQGTFSDEELITYHADESWDREVQHFFESIAREMRPTLGNSDDALQLMTTIDRIYKK